MKFISLLMALVLVSISSVYADQCPNPRVLDDVLSCLKENHYLVQLRKIEVNNNEHLEKSLGQRPNPVLGLQSLKRRGANQTQVTLMQEIDIGGRINNLKSQGRLQYSLSQMNKLITQEEVVEKVLLNIHHLLHLQETLKVNR